MNQLQKIFRTALMLGVIFFSFSNLISQNIECYLDTFPIPPANKHMLFYLQRTIDSNTVIYEVNLNEQCEIDKDKPVIVYWIDYNKGGVKSPLSYIQKKFAYGIKHKLVDKEKNIFKISLVSYKKIEMHLIPIKNGKEYDVSVLINSKLCKLTKILVNIKGGRYTNPNITSIELSGQEIATGTNITETIKIK